MTTVEERFWAKVAHGADDACWEWTAATTHGYGVFGLSRSKNVMAHRFAYELLVGPIPVGLHVDHLCRNPPCVNPAHLEPVTIAENIRRGAVAEVQRRRHAAMTHCKYGHEFTATNTARDAKGFRQCKACRAERSRGRRSRGTDMADLRAFREAALALHAKQCGCADPVQHIFDLAGALAPE